MKDDVVASEVAAVPTPASPLARGVMRMLGPVAQRASIPFRVVLAGGEVVVDNAAPAFSIVFRNAKAQRNVALQGYVGLLESYFDGGLDIEGDLSAAFRAGFEAGSDMVPNPIVSVRNRWHERRFSNRSVAQAKANAIFHYGLGEPFYRQWLDLPAMMYTCAYWKEGTTTLEEAQRNKMDHVCRKVRLSPGDTFVDVGSGWGGMLFHALEHYGAIGTGVNTTTRQVEETRAEIARRGLADKLKVVECDFREMPGQYDKLLSIGTLEHAGRDQLDDVIRAHADALKQGGFGVIHFIGHVGVFDTEFYIRRHIFPGGWIPSLAQAIEAMERHDLEVVDVENLRRHYALTLDAWSERFDRNWEAIHALDPLKFDERFRRTWRTYLRSCAEMFRARNGRTHLFQVTVCKGGIGGSNYPMNRSFLYPQRA